jgi:hypothetical protein
MSGVFGKHMSHVDTLHIVGMMHFYKYWPLVCFLPPVSKVTEVKGLSSVYCRLDGLVVALPQLIYVGSIWHVVLASILLRSVVLKECATSSARFAKKF